MATRSTTDTVDDLADAASSSGERAGATARKAGADLGDAIERTADTGAARARRTARKSVDAYEETADELEGQVASLEETIRRNPLAAAGAALLIGVVFGRFIL